MQSPAFMVTGLCQTCTMEPGQLADALSLHHHHLPGLDLQLWSHKLAACTPRMLLQRLCRSGMIRKDHC